MLLLLRTDMDIEIRDNLKQYVGRMVDVNIKPGNILVVQLPRPTNMLSDAYVEGAMRSVRAALHSDQVALLIGSDVSLYELAGEAAVELKLKGILM